MLRQALQGGAAARSGTGIAVRTESARLRDLSALGPGHPAGAVERRAERPVRPRHQRRRAGQYSGRQPRALRGADEPDQGAASSRHSARLRRNRHEGRQSQLVALGVPPWRQRRLRGRRPSLEGGRGGVPGRMAARLLDLGSPRQPDGLGQARASGLSGPSDPRRPIRHSTRATPCSRRA